MLQVGNRVYLGTIQVIPDGSGATTLQPLTLGALVPANAIRMFFEIKYYRAEADVNGNMDSAVSLRRPGDLTHNLHSIGLAGKGHSPYSQIELIGIPFDMPNDPANPCTILWVMQGAALNNTSWGLNFDGYELP